MPHALVVDDEPDSAETTAMLISSEGFTVATAGSLRDARRQIALQEPGLFTSSIPATVIPRKTSSERSRSRAAVGATVETSDPGAVVSVTTTARTPA